MQLPLHRVSQSIHRLALGLPGKMVLPQAQVALLVQRGRRLALLTSMHGWSSCRLSWWLPRAEDRCRRCKKTTICDQRQAWCSCSLCGCPLPRFPAAVLFILGDHSSKPRPHFLLWRRVALTFAPDAAQLQPPERSREAASSS